MRTTLNLRDDLVEEAQRATRIKEKTTLVHAGLRELISKAARERLIAMGGTEKRAAAPVRRR